MWEVPDLSPDGIPVSYQDRFVKGVITSGGKRECSDRYAAVLSVVDECSARTVLDIGADGGYFSYRLAFERGVGVTAVDGSPALQRAARENQDPRVRIVPFRVRARDIPLLGAHDVVLALAVLHHMVDWRKALQQMVLVASRALILEVPHPREADIAECAKARGEAAAIYEVVAALGEPIARTPATNDPGRERTLFVVRR